MNSPVININGQLIGQGHAPYIIAEMSCNHLGRLDNALKIVEEAAHAGVDAVKLQTLNPDMLTLDHDGPGFVVQGGLWHGRKLYDLYKEAQTPWEWHEALFAKGKALGITVFSSPFDHSAVDFLESIEAPAYKISSFELIDLPLIEKVSATGKPVIISTGMASQAEIEEALKVAQSTGSGEVALLHCVSGYPTPPEESRLHTISRIAETYNVVTGLSDHSPGITVAIAGVALGASIVEKHFTLDRSNGGLDAAFSLEPDELTNLVSSCRMAWQALGEVSAKRTSSEKHSVTFRRSLYVVENIAQGETFTLQNVRSIRPGHGAPPKHLGDILGKKAACSIKRGAPFDLKMISP